MKTLLVHDAPEPCPYLPGQIARMPLHLPVQPLDAETFDQLLEVGTRRSGPLLYRTQCASCQACEPIRVDVNRFTPNRTQKRAWKRNEGEIVAKLGPPELTARHLELYNRHKLERGLSRTGEESSGRDYRTHLLQTCVDTREVQYHLDGKLVAVSILDFGREAVSGVYHFFDPDLEARSLGVYSKLKEIEFTRLEGRRWFYLGLFVADCGSLSYKAAYRPHQRRVNGVWMDFE
ncbi:MAG: arginyltransferase [Deltaproteobacteria bacterium]|nr:arginyltransferase [Deltaproteobacteria bacterium]